MPVTMATHIMPVTEQALHYIGISLIKLSRKEESSFDTVLLQGINDGIGTVRLIGSGEYERDLLLRRVGTHNASFYVYVFITQDTGLLHPVFLHGREIVSETGRS